MSASVFPVPLSGIQETLIAAKGDLIVGTANDTPGILTAGTTNQVLTVDSSTATGLKWAAAAGGGMTQLATGTLSGTQVNISSISADYRELVLYIDGISTNSNNVVFTLRFNNNTSGYMWVGIQRTNTSTSTFGDDRMSEWNLTGATDTLASSNKQGVVVYVPNYANTVTRKQLWSMYTGDNNVANPFQSIRYMWGHWDGGGITPAVDTINLTASGSPFDNGTYYLYGVK